MNIKITKKRQEILHTLQTVKRPLSAAAVHALLPSTNLVTIYRNLELFTSEGLIKKLHLTGQEAAFEYQESPHHHAICTDCKKVIHFSAPDAKIISLLDLQDFVIDELEVTVRGHCH